MSEVSPPAFDLSPYLDPDERLLWQGRPAQGMRFSIKRIAYSLIFLSIFVLLIFWVLQATDLFSKEGGHETAATGCACDFLNTLLNWPFILFAIYVIFGHFFHDKFRRARTHYALTDLRALIILTGKTINLKSWPIGPDTIVDYEISSEANIHFAYETKTDSDSDKFTASVGFKLIHDGDEVYHLIRQIQTGRMR